MKNLDNLIDVKAVAKKLGYHPQYVRDLARTGKLPAIKRCRAWLFNEAEVAEYLERQSNDVKKESNYGRRATDEGSDLLR